MKIRQIIQGSSIFTKISVLTFLAVVLVSAVSTFLAAKDFSQEIQERDRLLVQEASDKIYTFFQDSYNAMYNQRTLLHSTGNISDLFTSTRSNPSTIICFRKPPQDYRLSGGVDLCGS